ncbi:MAG: hypothetical protein WC755_02220 [Candidatus Woesearchaeota archaeon]|jgi:hypothetical protein
MKKISKDDRIHIHNLRENELHHQLKEYGQKYEEEHAKEYHKDIEDNRKKIGFGFVKIIIGIVLLFLIVFYSQSFFNAMFNYAGKLQSSVIDKNFTVMYKDKTIIFEQNVYKKILAIYDSSKGNEIKVCLLGNIEGGKYSVTALYVPEIYVQTGINVVSAECDVNTIISLHSHPIDSCIFSDQDISSYEKFKEGNPNGMMGLMCSKTRFSFYLE